MAIDMQAAAAQEDQGEPQDDGGAEAGGGDVTKLVQTVGQGLQELGDILNKSQGATDQDRQQMAQIMSLFVDLVEKKLGGQSPGQDAPPEDPQGPSAVPADAGLKGQPMGPQSRM